MEPKLLPLKRQPQRLMACVTKTSLENMRNKALFALDVLDAKEIRRRKYPLYECLILELKEKGYTESSDYLNDLIYDNMQLLAEDEIGIVVDLRKRDDYLENIALGLQKAEKERDKEDKKRECIELLNLALFYAEKGKGILWLAEKFYLASIAVASQYLLDGGRQKACCKYHYAKFILDKFPGADQDEPFKILTEVRDASVGKGWPLYEKEDESDTFEDSKSKNTTDSDEVTNEAEEEQEPTETVFAASAIQLHRVLLNKVRAVRDEDPSRAERLSRLAERRAVDANQTDKIAEAIIEIGVSQFMMNNLNNAMKTLNRAYTIHTASNNIEGLCETKMHLSAVLQKMGQYVDAAKMLTEMGALAMEHCLRRQLGRALHMLGELHLLSERPELGTQHLNEAFSCFMGLGFQFREGEAKEIRKQEDGKMGMIYTTDATEIYIEEAEQSRLMMAISGGQEYMASYFSLIREGGSCAVAQMKAIEWKLLKAGWWVKRQHHDFLPCLCPVHNRTPLQVLKIQQELKEQLEIMRLEQSDMQALARTTTVEDIRTLRSSFYYRDSN